ncbi:hypothetical protein RND71_029193 [Anisodus tanguticus]|uniref:RWD domain-containing protein n=1 Tax=Anisodus tanguticus TaxID=243964 RepID=A0AAE1RCZ5_9SOLA|nr:hypothetical protein RND71_029193 [Anisodus tanguticus]
MIISVLLELWTDYEQEQEMEIEALEAILMDEFKGSQLSLFIQFVAASSCSMLSNLSGFIVMVLLEIHSSESGLNTSNRCFQITITPQEDDEESPQSSVLLALIFSHTEKYPDEPPLLNVSSLKGIHSGDLKILKEKLEQEAVENLGMAMVYTLVSSAKDWLSERFAQETGNEGAEDDEAKKEELAAPGNLADLACAYIFISNSVVLFTVETFLAWRERFEAELALEKAKLMPDSALAVTKEKRLTGRQWFESGRASGKAAAAIAEESDEDDIDFDDDNFEGQISCSRPPTVYLFVNKNDMIAYFYFFAWTDDEEEDMLEHYLAEKTNSSHS